MLSELQVDDDLDINVDPEGYVDQTNPKPPLPGVYRFAIVGDLKKRTDSSGQVVLADGKFETYTIQRVKIVEPEEAATEFGLFHDIRTKPFERLGRPASDIADICRSFDQTAFPEAPPTKDSWVNLLLQHVGGGAQFVAELDWQAYDAQFVEQEFERLGVTKTNAKEKLTKDVLNAIYKKARLYGSAFKADGKGSKLNFTTGPSGATLEAKPRIAKFIPSLTPFNLGVKRVK